MKRSSYVRLLAGAFLVVLGIIPAACNAGQDVAKNTIEVTFDGDGCKYQGSKEVSESDISVRVDNQSEGALMLDVLRFQEGKTYEDLVAYFGSGAGPAELPSWSRSVASMPASARESVSVGMALSAGNYALVCSTELPTPQVQPVAAFTVVP